MIFNGSLSKKLIMYKFACIKPLLDYADIIYDKIFNESVKRKLEAVPHNARLAITGLIGRTYRELFYHELGLESQSDPRWFYKLFFFHKVAKGF